ncbi:hypothetical protein [Streptomyces sp. MST-110588]|uniref:hypothetical protein n=1 Tax=Streptomyces sp. MST-110588 TaxID=2833628 RepID=UPI001F5D4CCA|nr:hypothetical protein [Streptomyces sp. MST-110588]UNO39595.1 hypothetical protein KGS77_08235 [Streptomyces sp. MST-110588]
MEAGPRNRPQKPDGARGDAPPTAPDSPGPPGPRDEPGTLEEPAALADLDGLDGTGGTEGVNGADGLGEPGDRDALDGSDGPDAQDPDVPKGGESFRELRPPRRLRLWQLAPIVGLAAVGSLMFAFPLAFEFGGDGGAMIAMLGLLLSCCAAGWGMMAARRVGYPWPGLPARGSGRRPEWRVVLAYVAVVAVPAALAIWRVARLR